MYSREENNSAFGHIANGGGATIKDSPINITLNVHIHVDGKGTITGAIANAYRKRFGKPIDPQILLEYLIPRLDYRDSEDGRLHGESIKTIEHISR